MDDCLKLYDDELFTQSDFEVENEDFSVNSEENATEPAKGKSIFYYLTSNFFLKKIYFFLDLNKFPEFNCNDGDFSENTFYKNGFVNNLDVENFTRKSEVKQDNVKLFGLQISLHSFISNELVGDFFKKARMNILKIQLSIEKRQNKFQIEQSFHELRLEVRTFLHILRTSLDLTE